MSGLTLARLACRRRPALKVIDASGHLRAFDGPGRQALLGPLLTKSKGVSARHVVR